MRRISNIVLRGLVVIAFITPPVFAQTPFFSSVSEKEYRSTVDHLQQMLPDQDEKAKYIALLRPFGLLDVHATNFSKASSRAEFATFNLGVMGGLLSLTREDLVALPELLLCRDDDCVSSRLEVINQFLEEAEKPLNQMAQSESIFAIGQLSKNLYRINNTFFSQGEIYTYQPSKEGGFIPSAVYTRLTNTSASQQVKQWVADTAQLRLIMANYNIAAIVRSAPKRINIIFNGIADNHWGAEIGDNTMVFPKTGDVNHLGFKYDKVEKAADNAFYYQTD